MKKSFVFIVLIALSIVFSVGVVNSSEKVTANALPAEATLAVSETYDPACCASCVSQYNPSTHCFGNNPPCYIYYQQQLQACLETCETGY
jgi:hypothetical protein